MNIRWAMIGAMALGCAKGPEATTAAPAKAKKQEAIYGAVCTTGPTPFESVIVPIAEDLQSQEIWYTQSGDRQDCSGVFHRVLEAYQAKCPAEPLAQYEVDRTSRQLGSWYLNKGLLTVVSDPVAQSNLILPGSVLFFGPGGPDWTKMDPAAAMEAIRHVGVVTSVQYDEAGAIESYSMFHGRRTGTYAAITNDHRLTGKPPFGNGPDAIIGIAPIATPLAPATAIAPAKKKGAKTVEPGTLVCGKKNVRATTLVRPIINGLIKDKVRVSKNDEGDRIGLFTAIADEVAEQCPQLARPPERAREGYEPLAQWFYTSGQFRVVDDPAKRGDWLQPGSVLFFGPANLDYSGMDPEDVVNRVDSIGVVEAVIRTNGVITGYTIFHAPPEDEGGLATVSTANPVSAALPFGFDGRVWLGVAPMFTRTPTAK